MERVIKDDLSGEQNFKFTSPRVRMTQNAALYMFTPPLADPTLYASPLITLSKHGYTKHYFEGMNRVCSKLGGGFDENLSGDIERRVAEVAHEYLQKYYSQRDGVRETFLQGLGLEPPMETRHDLAKVVMNHELGRDNPEPAFFYHSDHLGSAAYLTNDAGQVAQTLNYLPYGEDWVDIQNYAETRYPRLGIYTFNGKEKDHESGFHYYGERYYWSEVLTGWLSVDPMMDKYPSVSPYAYCLLNPVKFIDPDGQMVDDIYVNTQTKQVSIIRTNDNFDNVIIDGAFAGQREKGKETSLREGQGYAVNELQIRYASGVNKDHVSFKTKAVLVDAMNEANSPSIQINSTMRSPHSQAKAMYNNVKQYGIDSQKKLYGTNGDRVLDLYPDIDAMTQKIYELGPSNVSHHCGDPSILNVIDISPRMENGDQFYESLQRNPNVSKSFGPSSSDPAYHIEVPQQ